MHKQYLHRLWVLNFKLGSQIMNYFLTKIFYSYFVLSLLLFSYSPLANELVSECQSLYNSEDYDVAYEVCKTAAEQGDAEAQYLYSKFYYDGLGREIDEVESIRWLRMASDQGFPIAQYDLGRMYLYGHGVEVDVTKTLFYTMLAANNGHAIAKGFLGTIYYDGIFGIEQNYSLAAQWYTLAAKQNIPIYQLFLARMYRKGLSLPQDNVLSLMWYDLSNNDSSEAVKFWSYSEITELINEMDPYEIMDALRLSISCSNSNFEDCGY